jgi:phage FluMu protein Com
VPSNTLTAPSRSSEASVAGKGRGASAATPAVMIRFRCASCDEKLSVPEKFGGRKGTCPNCGSVNRVPLPGAEAAPAAPAAAPMKPVFVELPAPQARTVDAPTARPATAPAPHTPYADHAAAPVPARNTGAELAERPDRWTRGPLQIEADEEEDDHSAGGLLRLFVDGSEEEDQWVLGHRKQWEVDKRGLPLVVKVGLLLTSVIALIGLVWGFFYLLLRVVIAVNG